MYLYGLSHLHHQVTERRGGKKQGFLKVVITQIFLIISMTIEFLVSYQLLLKISQNP